MQQCILAAANKIVAEWPSLTSVVHFEGKILGDQVFPLEVNLRVGGAEAPACVEAVTGVDLASLVPLIALETDNAVIRAHLPSMAARPDRYARSVNIQLDPNICQVTACGPRTGTAGPESLPGYIGAQYYCKVGDRIGGGTVSQRCLAWVAAAGESHEDADRTLERCLALCEFAGTAAAADASELF